MELSLRNSKKWSNFLVSSFSKLKRGRHSFSYDNQKIHLLRGFSEFRPRNKVLETIHNEIYSYEQEQKNELCNRNFVSKKFKSGAFYLLDLNEVQRTINLWKHTFPTIQPYFAMKANPQKDILKLFANQTDTGYDCASQHEIEQVLEEGVSPHRIIFAHPIKQQSHLLFAYKNGIHKTVFDSDCELYKLRRIGLNWKLFLRFKVDDRLSQCPLSTKYGASFEECVYLFRLAKELGLKIEGLNFHCGSSAHPNTYIEAFDLISKLIPYANLHGHSIQTIDCGGGYTHESIVAIRKNIQESIRYWNSEGIKFISEPGRLFVATAQTLVVKVIGKKERPDGSQLINVCDSIYRTFSNVIYDHSKLIEEKNGCPTLLGGITCDGFDSFETKLPKVEVDDWLIIPSVGAYSSAASTLFNGFSFNEFVVVKS